MATRFVAPPFRDRGRDLVVKVKYNGTLKRFNAHVNGSQFDHSLVALRSKIASAFKFSSDVEFILTYTDEDGDVVMLDDENDLRDAAINQKLNPLRIDIQLKNDNIKAPRTKHQALNSRSLRSTTLEDQLVHVKSAIDEAMKFVPEQVPAVLTKLSHDLRSRAASSVPSLAELLDRLATLMTPKGNAEASSGHAYGSSCSSSGGPEASRNTKIEHENKLMTGSASQSPDMQTAPGLKSVLPEDPEAQVEQAPVYHSVDSLKFTGSLGNKSHRKGSTIAESMHKWIQCDGCGATPIPGPRYKSNVKDDYDLCLSCFSLTGNESEYTRLDKPASVDNQDLHGHLQQGELKLECCFISDITIPDGTSMGPSNLFTKIWRLRNSGCAVWPFGTQVIWVGGDQFGVQNSVKLEISMDGVAGGQEVDVAVDFLAPAKPGRYKSYWRLALPSGKKFGQRIWVHIQVEEPIQTNGNKLSAAINLNLPPATNSTTLKPSIEMNSGFRDPFFQYPLNIYNEMPPRYRDSMIHLESDSEPDSPTDLNFQYPNYSEAFARFQKPIILKEPEPASSTLTSIPAADKQAQILTTDHHASSSGPAFTLMASAMPAPETIPLPEYISFAVPVSASGVPAPASLPVQTPSSVSTAVLPDDTINHKEEKLLRELEELGFGQADLNKEIIRQNKYDLEQSVRDLSGLSDWDPLLGELAELGFNDAEMNKEAVAEGSGGSIKGLVMNLVARAKKDR
ncbi:hypothetical protein QOZ80_4BG0344740 [Eleusine coracana subsp. coracana]|nr:hypothetical protein QOZ80_4BG0344740 [Eleusine coracana subsp. coracana]